MGYTMGAFPPGVKDACDRHLAVNEAMVPGPPAGRRGAAGRARATSRSASPCRWPRWWPRGRARRAATPPRRSLEDTFLRATGGDDFVGVQCYTRMRFGPEGGLGADPGVAVTQMGYEYWPQALEYTVRRARRGAPGSRWW